MKTKKIFFLLFIILAIFQSAFAQSREPIAVVLTVDGPIMPAMRDYIQRGIKTAEQRNAELVVIEINTPGGQIDTMLEIITSIRASEIPVVVYVSPKNAIAGSAGATMAISSAPISTPKNRTSKIWLRVLSVICISLKI